MHNSKIIHGKNISIYQLNDYYSNVTKMLLEYFDNDKHNEVFILGNYIFENSDNIKKQFPKRKIIAYQLEQMMGTSNNWHSIQKTINNLKTYDEIWDYDELNIAYLKNHNINVSRLLPMLYTKNLKNIINDDDPKIDVLFYGFINQRRFNIIESLQKKLYGKIKLVWIYGETNLDQYIANSKIILNLHAFEPWNRQEQIRMFYPIINEKTVISEISQKNYLKDLIIESSIDNIVETIVNCCTNNIWRSFGKLSSLEFYNRTQLLNIQ